MDQQGPQLLAATLRDAEQDALVAYSQRLFSSIFRDDAEVDESLLTKIAADLGLEKEGFLKDLKSPETAVAHETIVAEAQSRGAFGVPSFFLEDRLFWGNDRLCLLEAALAGLELPPFQRP